MASGPGATNRHNDRLEEEMRSDVPYAVRYGVRTSPVCVCSYSKSFLIPGGAGTPTGGLCCYLLWALGHLDTCIRSRLVADYSHY